MSWHKFFFSDPNYKNNYSYLTKERTDKEIDFLDRLFKKHKVSSVLDIPCGFGRHSIPLAKLGYVVHGIDLYKNQLEMADKTIVDEKLDLPNLTFSQKDMRNYQNELSKNTRYDAVINMFMSFGYYTREEDEKILNNLCNSVANNGILIIEVRNPYYFLPKMIASDYKITETDDKGRKNTITFNPVTSKLTIDFDGKRKAEMNIYFPIYYKENIVRKGFEVSIDFKKHKMFIVAEKR